MRTFLNYLSLLIIAFLVISCFNLNKVDKTEGRVVDFSNLKSMNATEIIYDYSYVPLESSESSLFGNINQIEIYNNKIYILDNSKTNALYVFTIDGKFVTKLKGTGNGPGEFISPHSFWIDNNESIFILDRQLNRLLKYQLDNLKFVNEITPPAPSPLSFAIIPSRNLYLYYYPLRENDAFSGKQFIVADSVGNVIKSFYDAPLSGKILHGNSTNFYLFNNHIRTYPYFSNNIYELNGDSLACCYSLSWGDSKLPPHELFMKFNNSGEIMKEILTGDNDWIRLLYVYELPNLLVVKYYIKKDFYLSIWNKDNDKVINVKSEYIVDDLGIGKKIPLPMTTYDDKFVGMINPFDIIKDEVKDKHLFEILNNIPEESNPILVFYKLKCMY